MNLRLNLRLIISFIIAVFILPISVSAGQVVLTKEVDKSSAKPDEIVGYNIIYQNSGTSTLTGVNIIDVIPTNTIFQEAVGTNTTIYYAYDNSDNFGTSSTLPVTKVKWVIGNVPEGNRGTVTLRVKIK